MTDQPKPEVLPWIMELAYEIERFVRRGDFSVFEIAQIIEDHVPKPEASVLDWKSIIIDRLYDTESVCTCCGKKGKGHGNYKLPERISRESVLRAINLDEYYFKEAGAKEQK